MNAQMFILLQLFVMKFFVEGPPLSTIMGQNMFEMDFLTRLLSLILG